MYMNTSNLENTRDYYYLINIIDLMQLEINILKYQFELQESSIRSMIRSIESSHESLYTPPHRSWRSYTRNYDPSTYSSFTHPTQPSPLATPSPFTTQSHLGTSRTPTTSYTGSTTTSTSRTPNTSYTGSTTTSTSRTPNTSSTGSTTTSTSRTPNTSSTGSTSTESDTLRRRISRIINSASDYTTPSPISNITSNNTSSYFSRIPQRTSRTLPTIPTIPLSEQSDNRERNLPRTVEVSMFSMNNPSSSLENIIERLNTINIDGDSNIISHETIFNSTTVHCYNETGNETGNETVNCTICLEEIKSGDIVRKIKVCGHYFHINCADTWFKDNVTCPYCRQDIQGQNNSNDNNDNNDNNNNDNNDNDSDNQTTDNTVRRNRYYTTLSL
jgi:hypothetical protein